jgi:hypothetical protein
VAIVDAMNKLGGGGLWDEADGFYYDRINVDGRHIPLKLRSMVGLVPLFTCEILEQEVIDRLPGFSRRLNWFLENRKDLARHISYMAKDGRDGHGHRLLAIPSKDRLERVLRYLLDEGEFLSPHGIRSLSKVYERTPYVLEANGQRHVVSYVPGESNTGLFGGNSNWRGPVWFPANYLLVEALERYHHFYQDDLEVECPVGSGKMMNLLEVSQELATRLARVFLRDGDQRRPVHGGDERYASDPRWKDLVLFYEYFHGDTGRGVGASHQTGWTAVATRFIEKLARGRDVGLAKRGARAGDLERARS